jgi:hypothetical protein
MAAAEARSSNQRVRRPYPLRYRVTMRKSPPKLVLRKETVRALSGMDLARVIGGDPDAANLVAQTGAKQCSSGGAAIIPGG